MVKTPFDAPVGISDSDGYPVNIELKRIKAGTRLSLSVEDTYPPTSLLDLDSGERVILLNNVLEALVSKDYLVEVNNV